MLKEVVTFHVYQNGTTDCKTDTVKYLKQFLCTTIILHNSMWPSYSIKNKKTPHPQNLNPSLTVVYFQKQYQLLLMDLRESRTDKSCWVSQLWETLCSVVITCPWTWYRGDGHDTKVTSLLQRHQTLSSWQENSIYSRPEDKNADWCIIDKLQTVKFHKLKTCMCSDWKSIYILPFLTSLTNFYTLKRNN